MLLFDNILFDSFIPQVLMAFLLIQCGFWAVASTLSETQAEPMLLESRDVLVVQSQLYNAPSESVSTVHLFDELSSWVTQNVPLLPGNAIGFLSLTSLSISIPIGSLFFWYQEVPLFRFSRPPPTLFIF